MQQTFTPELLVKHLYNETTPSEASAINQALAKDTALQQEFKQLQESKNALDEADGEAPDASVLQKILAFSNKQELAESH